MHSAKLINALSNGLAVTGGRVVGLGIDVVHIPRIEESMRSFGECFAERMFTAAEAEYARSAPQQQAERLAARFAAKEATIKALSLSEAGVDWRDIEVVRQQDGSCGLALHGKALDAARARGVASALVCLSHDGDYAAAVVAVLSDTAEQGGPQEFTA
jgi:holo-[acyl-carrier protein] synthase